MDDPKSPTTDHEINHIDNEEGTPRRRKFRRFEPVPSDSLATPSAGQPPIDDSKPETTEPPEPVPTQNQGLSSPSQAEAAETSGESPLPLPSESSPDRHPTGAPEQTGGWYAQDTTTDTPSERPILDQTLPVSPENSKTQVVAPVPSMDTPGPAAPPLPSRKRRPTSLPQPVSQTDPYATRVTPTAYTPGPAEAKGASTTADKIRNSRERAGTGGQAATRPLRQGGRPDRANSDTQSMPLQPATWRRPMGCAIRGVIGLLFAVVLLIVIGGAFAVYQYYRIAATLPNVSDLQKRASQFETTRILDRNGNTLYEILDPNAGRRTYVPLDKISPYLIAATLATEDNNFYKHPGFDPFAIARAFVANYTSGETVSGASTITQQLARALLFSPEERVQQSYERKMREVVLAAEITRRYTKEQILELYLNENYYGNLAYGIEAASETYFNTTADKLDMAQAAFLAGLPQAPGVYDIYTNREATLRRNKQVLILMYQHSTENNCLEVSSSRQPVCISADAAANAAVEMENYPFKTPTIEMRYPHFVNYVRSLLEEQFDPQTIYRSGFTVFTTIDPGLQDQAQQLVRDQVDKLADRHVTDGALVAIRPNTGEILAMVGSADFYNEAISGQVNMATSSTRQPGSAIKPLTYVSAFEKGWTPSTLIWDVPTAFPPSGDPNDPRPPYEPPNYDHKFHGPVTVRTALANSYNIPAVKALNFIGIYGDPNNPDQGGLVNMAKRMGITTLTRPDYGLALTLGGGEVSLLEMTGAYAVFANEGRRIPPVAITKIVDHDGKVVYEYQPPTGDQVIRAEHAFLITSILSDNNARAPMFGTDSVLNVGFPAAVKTGTTNDYRDNWTIGYTPDITVGVWVGNADYSAMEDTSGVTGAAPIWADFMKFAMQQLTGGNPTPFIKPAGVIERVVCAVSGAEPSQWCPSQRSEFFAADQPPQPKEQDLWEKAQVDTWTGLGASQACGDFVEEKFALNVKDPTAMQWIRTDQRGEDWAISQGFSKPIYFAPERACKADDPRPLLSFANLSEGQTISTSPLDINGTIDATGDFGEYRLEYGVGTDPSEWKVLMEHGTAPVKDKGKIYTWDLKDLPAGQITLRIYLQSNKGTYAIKKIHLNLQVPTPTPTPTMTPTMTLTPTLTSTPLPPTATPLPPTATPIPPTNTPLPPTDTPAPAPTATETVAPVMFIPTDTATPAVEGLETPTASTAPEPSATPTVETVTPA